MNKTKEIVNSAKPLVGIIMGSASDMPVMKEATAVLEHFKISYEVRVLSAHRTPQETAQYAVGAEKNGLKVLIAAAGGAAHLAGVAAGLSNLPVIGVPIKSKSFEGMDSLLSMAQMPAGVPVATMAVDGAKNAALFAVRILATQDTRVQKLLQEYKFNMRADVLEKAKSVNVRKIL